MIFDFTTLIVVAASQVLAAQVPECPRAEPGETGAGAAGAMCTARSWADAVTGLPGWLWHQVTGNWMLLLSWCALGAVLAVCWQVWRRWLLRRAVGRGTWLEVVPPRQTAVTASTAVWRLLSSLAGRASGGLHMAHPPLAVEIHGDGRGRLLLAVWVPKWVPASVVTAETGRAWPGALVRPSVPPMASEGAKAAGFRMAAQSTDHEQLVDDVYIRSRLAASVSPQGDPLRPVFNALQDGGGPTVLQVLAKPASGKRLSRLALAARRPESKPRPLGLKALNLMAGALSGGFRLLLDLVTPGSSPVGRYHRGNSRPEGPDLLQRLAMRRAAEKLKGGPHLLVAIRAVALRPTKGWAVTEASSLANGYRVAASGLRPKRLWWAHSAVSDRYARRGEWLLATCSELGVLFHLPADPARFGFTVAAVNRPFPNDAARLRPEQPSGSQAGWSRGRWDMPEGTTFTGLAMHNGDDSHGEDGFGLGPWGMPFSDPHPHSENNTFIDDDLDSDWDF
ncbi:MAG TPA: hypothetical protein DGT23_10600 [Micromonosporaceae bacterium]|nr:hypothetical protein [Micromonosporaceae bacterium]